MLPSKVWVCVSFCIITLAAACGESPEDPGQAGSTASMVGARAAATQQPLAMGMRDAERIVVATVDRVDAQFGLNEFGDKLILSTVTLRVHESLRGDVPSTATFQLEGGTVGELTLDVSDLPKLEPGDRGVFSLRRTRMGDGWVPNRRSLGIVLMDIEDDLEAVRRVERACR